MLVSTHSMSAKVLADSITVYFPVSKTEIYDDYMDNGGRLESFDRRLDSLSRNPDYDLVKVSVCGAASPEGSYRFNQWLACRRAVALLSRVRSILDVPDSIISTSSCVGNWGGLRESVRSDSLVPDRNAVLGLLKSTSRGCADAATTAGQSDRLLQRLRELDENRAYRYMLVNMFPSLREATLRVTYNVDSIYRIMAGPVVPHVVVAPDTVHISDMLHTAVADDTQKVTWALRTNLLYDAIAIPNIGIELYTGHNISIQCEWMYAWWSHRSKNFFWRLYGGDIGVRWWFGGVPAGLPPAGQHLGVYAQALIWDFEFGGRGYMGGVPGGAIWDRANFGAGIEYGYSVPVTERMSIDFCIGVGYIGGACREYIPRCGYYVWQSTRQLNYVGPTKLEISLVHTF